MAHVRVNINLAVTDSSSALSGTLPTHKGFSGGQVTDTGVTLTTDDNTAQNDGAREVTFALALNSDFPYTLDADATSVTIIVRDDDTPPLAVGDLRAQAGNTEATLRWDAPPAPTPDHGQPILHYEYRVKEGTGSFGSWAMIPNSDGHHKPQVHGPDQWNEYTYEVRAENVAGDGAEVDRERDAADRRCGLLRRGDCIDHRGRLVRRHADAGRGAGDGSDGGRCR